MGDRIDLTSGPRYRIVSDNRTSLMDPRDDGSPLPQFVSAQNYFDFLRQGTAPFQIAQYGQQITQPRPVEPVEPAQPAQLAAPITVDSPHCLDSSITDLQHIFQTFGSDPCAFTQTQILPKIVDHGRFEIQLGAPLNAGTYRGGVVVGPNTWMDARLFVEDGLVRGTIDFFPPITKQDGILGFGDASLSQLQIQTDPSTKAITFSATATFLNLPITTAPINVTIALTQTLFGQPKNSVPGPASQFLQTFLQAQGTQEGHLENLVNMAAARFRIVANPGPRDPLVPALGDVSNAHIRLPHLEISPALTLSDIDATIEVWPNRDGGFTVHIPNASIGEIRHSLATPCGDQHTTIPNVRLTDVVIETVPTGDRNRLGNDMFQAASQALSTLAHFCAGQQVDLHGITPPMYVRSGGGQIQMGRISVNDDIIINPMEGDHALRFSISDGQPNGDLRAVIDAPEMGINRAAFTVGGDLLQNRSVTATIDDAILRNLHATFDMHDGTLHYTTSFTPSLASAVLNAHDPSGRLLVGVSRLGFDANVLAEGTVTPTEFTLDRLLLPQYRLNADISAPGRSIGIGLSNGAATRRMAAGVQITRDTTGPTAGVTSTLSLNTRTDRLRFTIPNVGAFEMSGPLTGTMGMATTTSPIPPNVSGPAFHPVAGSMRLHLNGTIRQVSGGHLRLSGPIDITDTARGRISIRSRSSISGIGMSDAIRNHSRITADLSREIRRFSPQSGLSIPYYDFDPSMDHTIPLPSIFSQTAVPNIGTFGVTGSGQVSDVPGNPRLTVFFPFGQQRAEIQDAAQGIDARLDFHGGSLAVNANARRTALTLQPPREIQVRFTQVEMGVTLTCDGTLHSRSTLQASVNPRTRRLSFRETGSAPQLTGDLTVMVNGMGSGTVHVSTAYSVSGNLGESAGRIALHIPDTGLMGEVTQPIHVGDLTLPTGTRLNLPIRNFQGQISLNPQTQAFTSIWTLGDIGPATVEIPRLALPGGGPAFENVTAEFSTFANSQRWEVSRGHAGQSTFRALPDASGALPPFRIQLGVHDGDGEGLSLTLGSTTQASGISGRIDPATGETVLDVTGITLGSRVDGRVRINGVEIALPNITTDGNLPALQVRINQQTHELRLTARPPQPAGVAHPPTALSSWRRWTTGDWRTYQTQMNGTHHLAVLSESVMNAPIIRNKLPGGRGQVYVDMEGLPSTPLAARLDDPASVQQLMAQIQSSLRFRREFPNPPPRRRGETGETILLSDAQRPLYRTTTPQGTLFFISQIGEDGQPHLNPDLSRTLQESLGISTDRTADFLRTGRIEMDELTGLIRHDRTVAAAVDETTLANLVTSYLNDSRGSFRRFSQRMFITLGNIQRSFPGSTESRIPGILGPNSRGLRAIYAHQFMDTSYHAASGANDGTDMQFMAVLPLRPDQIGQILETHSTDAWDPWVTDAHTRRTTESGTLLGDHGYRVVRSPQMPPDGNIRVYRILPEGSSGMVASSRTIRIVPLSEGRSLLVTDQHEDYPGTDSDIRLPRMRLPDSPPVDRTLLGTQAVGALSRDAGGRSLLRLFGVAAGEPGPFPLTPFYANRFAQTADLLLRLGGAPMSDRIAFDSRVPLSATVSNFEFLGYDETDATHPFITIALDAPSELVRQKLTERLGVTDDVAGRWIGNHRIPLDELLTQTHLGTHFTLDTFRSLARAMLAPPDTIQTTMQHFTAPTERFLDMMEDLRHVGDLRRPLGDGLGIRARVFRDQRFHQRSTAEPDTIDNYFYWYVPGNLGVTPADLTWFVHHAELFPNYEPDNFLPSSVVPNAQIPGADGGRIYVDTGVKLPGDRLYYRISVSHDPIVFPGGVIMSLWRQENRPGYRDFFDNQGWWLALPLREGGYLVVRAGIINTRVPDDRSPTFENEAGTKVIHFVSTVIRAAREHAGATGSVTIPTYERLPGQVVEEGGH